MPVVLLLFYLVGACFALDASIDDRLKEAEAAYILGEMSTDSAKAQQAINQALAIYHSLPAEKQNAKLYHNIGNCYYRLGEYPWAILYYKRAKLLEPRNDRIQHALGQALTQAGLTMKSCRDPWLLRIVGGGLVSMNERIWMSALCGTLLVISVSIAIWSRLRPLYSLSLGLAIAAFLLLAGLAVSQYGVSPQAIVMRGCLLRIDGGMQYAPVRERPLLSGSKVAVKSLSGESPWAEVVTMQGERGFVPCENLRIL